MPSRAPWINCTSWPSGQLVCPLTLPGASLRRGRGAGLLLLASLPPVPPGVFGTSLPLKLLPAACPPSGGHCHGGAGPRRRPDVSASGRPGHDVWTSRFLACSSDRNPAASSVVGGAAVPSGACARYDAHHHWRPPLKMGTLVWQYLSPPPSPRLCSQEGEPSRWPPVLD